jgi:uncharacterized membrane protein
MSTVFALFGLLFIVIALFQWWGVVTNWGPRTFAEALTWTLFALVFIGASVVLESGPAVVRKRLGGD